MPSLDDTVHALIDRLQAEALKHGKAYAIKTRLGGLRGRELREALKTVDYYERALNRAILDFYRDEIDANEFLDEMTRLIEGQFSRAWNEGGRDVGVEPKDHTPEDDDELQKRIDQEVNFVLDFAIGIEEARIKGDPVKPFQDRISLWTNRYNEVVNDARIWFDKQGRFEWVLGATEEHCATCAELNGIVATGEIWEASGFQPQSAPNAALECGGWRCDCSLEPTKKPATDKQPGDVKPAG